MVTAGGVIREATALSEVLGIDDLDLTAMAPHLERYAELVVAEHALEVITGGVGNAEELAALVGEGPAVNLFLACARAFPGRMLGVKRCFGSPRVGPTLYVRTMACRQEVEGFLTSHSLMLAAPSENRTIYGLGFSTDADGLVVKSYVVGDVDGRPGFISYRTRNGRVAREIKRYVPDVAWADVPRLGWIERVRERVPVARVGHVGVVNGETKLYLERIGAIPSDFSAR